jgi:DNA invertase Pin-like site-specific DNA recombinase
MSAVIRHAASQSHQNSQRKKIVGALRVATQPLGRYSSRHLAYVPAAAEFAPKIRQLRDAGMTVSELAKRFGLSYPTIWKLLHSEKDATK